MPKTIETATVNNRLAVITIITCEKCGGEIRLGVDPFIVDQSTLTLMHPDGYTEMVHQNNEQNGYFNYYCLKCKAAIPYISKDEIQKVDEAIVRRAEMTKMTGSPK